MSGWATKSFENFFLSLKGHVAKSDQCFTFQKKLGYIRAEADELFRQCEEISKIISGLIKSTRS